MKRKITLSIALAVSVVLVLLTNSDSSVEAQQNQIKVIADTGVLKLGPNQILRLSAVSVDGELGGGIYGLRFRQTNYTQGVCDGGVCKLIASSQTTSEVITMQPGDAAGFDAVIEVIAAARVVVSSNNRNVRVNASIIDTVTGNVVAVYIPSTGAFF